MKASMSPTAGIKSGMKGFNLCSSSMDCGVYLRIHNRKCPWYVETFHNYHLTHFGAPLFIGIKIDKELTPTCQHVSLDNSEPVL